MQEENAKDIRVRDGAQTETQIQRPVYRSLTELMEYEEKHNEIRTEIIDKS